MEPTSNQPPYDWAKDPAWADLYESEAELDRRIIEQSKPRPRLRGLPFVTRDDTEGGE